MSKFQKLAGLVVSSALLLPVAGFAQSTYEAERYGYGRGTSADNPSDAKDSSLSSRIKQEMSKDTDVRAHNITVDADNSGVVQLSGYASSQSEADQAVSIARRVPGVSAVQDNIRVDPEQGTSRPFRY